MSKFRAKRNQMSAIRIRDKKITVAHRSNSDATDELLFVPLFCPLWQRLNDCKENFRSSNNTRIAI